MRFNRAFRNQLALAIAGVALWISAAEVPAETISACVSRTTGAVRIVSSTTACDSRKETSLAWNTAGPQGPPGPPGPGALRYMDASNQLVGFHYAQGLTVRFVGTANEPVSFPVNLAGAVANGLYYFYESANCTGTGYALADPNNVVRSGFNLTNSATLRYAPRTGTVRDLRSQTSINPDGSVQFCVPFDGPLTRAAAPFVEVTLPTFLPPVRLTP